MVTVIKLAVDELLDNLKNWYQCEGPTAIGNIVYSRKDLLGMEYGKQYCEWRPYKYTTGHGCINVIDPDTKQSYYQAQHCIQRLKQKKSRTFVA